MSWMRSVTKTGMVFSIACAAAAFAVWSCGKSELNYGGPSRQQPNSNDNPIANSNQGSAVKVRYGTLELVPGPLARSGIVNYAIYEDGTITYDGFVSFMGLEGRELDRSRYSDGYNDGYSDGSNYRRGYNNRYDFKQVYQFVLTQAGRLMSQSFHGGTRVAPASILSSTYRPANGGAIEKEIQMKVYDSNANMRSVSVDFLPVVHRPYFEFGSPTDHDAKGTVQIDTSSDIVDIIDAEFQGRVFNETITLRAKKVKLPPPSATP